MKRLLFTALFLLGIAAVGYIALMGMLDGGVTLDITRWSTLSDADQTPELPRFLRIGTEYEFRLEGTDAEGNRYTRFCYSLPDAFESAEMECVVSWSDGTVTAIIGDSRGLEYRLEEAYPTVEWN